ncbi:MAG: ferrous iron transport protein A [Erysipelotrichaceae bacterium]|jgi:ferrous iron transport protein A|nr:ferrous iron transport protein A [Erysipelotrichaceae bacterium]
MKTLHDLPIAQEGIIQEVHNPGTIKRRLLDLGILKGSSICPMLENATHDMRAYMIKGALIALRSSESSLIEVEERR